MTILSTRGDLPSIIKNTEKLYEGTLTHYFQVVFFKAQNLEQPYHNFRHMSHVLWLCYQACKYYQHQLNPVQMRKLLIAALFHDFDHSGQLGNDDLNILKSLRALEKNIAPEDKGYLEDIKNLIRATEYPHTCSSEDLTLSAKIIQDADIAQALNPAWIQQTIFGLAKEWNKTPIEILGMQEGFHRNLKFNTDWAKTMFPQREIDAKIQEAQELLVLLRSS